jgi:chorismate synthase
MSIPAVKGVGIGLGFNAGDAPGSQSHDEILRADGPGSERTGGFGRPTNRAGGLEGGITTGEPLVLRIAKKPISTLMTPLRSVNLETGEAAAAQSERSDTTAVPAAAVIAEAMTALVLADAYAEKFGGDSLGEMRRNFDGYVAQLAGRSQKWV